MNKHIKIEKSDKYVLSDIEFFTNPLIHKELIDDNEYIEIIVDVNKRDINTIKTISKAITDLIIHISKNKILKKYINKVYANEDKKEIEDIYKKASEVFESQKYTIRNDILIKVEEHMKNNDLLDVEGFIKFRIKELDLFMPRMLELAVEKYIIEKEQEELTSILRYFINIQEEKLEVLKINISNNGSFAFYDKNNREIKKIEPDDIEKSIRINNMEYEDLFISNLLSFCPEKIEIEDNLNNEDSKQVVNTIRTVFGDKVSYINVR